MTEDLRALLRAELGAERPPPLGDVVGAAIRDGRRMRRKRRLGTYGAALALVAGTAGPVVLVCEHGVAGRTEVGTVAEDVTPGSGPGRPIAATAAAEARTLTIHDGTVRVEGSQTKATSAAMLHLLTHLLSPGRTSHYAVSADDDLRVQLYVDNGSGPAMVGVAVRKAEADAAGNAVPGAAGNAEAGAAGNAEAAAAGNAGARHPVTVTINHMPDNCLRSTVVDAAWPDGTLVEVDVATCLPGAGRPHVPPALTADEAVRIATDPRWGVTMDDDLVAAGAREFPAVPVSG